MSKEEKRQGNFGYYGMPEAKQVAQDLIVQMMTPESIVASMQVEQHFFEEGSTGKHPYGEGFIDGFHVDIVLKDEFIQECK